MKTAGLAYRLHSEFEICFSLLSGPVGEDILAYSEPDLGHESLVKTQIMERQEDWAEHFGYIEEVSERRPTEVLAAVTVATGLYGGRIRDVNAVSEL